MHRRTRKDPPNQENCSTRRLHGHGGNRQQIRQYLQLWILYAEISIELKKKSELSKESAVNACKVYGPYITDILRQVDEVIKLFSMEKELRENQKQRRIPSTQIHTRRHKNRDHSGQGEGTSTGRQRGRRHVESHKEERRKLRKRTRGSKEQGPTTKADKTKTNHDRSDFNFFTIVNSTPIRNSNPRRDQPVVHFDTNPV